MNTQKNRAKRHQLFAILTLATLMFSGISAYAQGGCGMEGVNAACQVNPQSVKEAQSQLDSYSSEDGIAGLAQSTISLCESAASTNRSTSSSCQSAGDSCASSCNDLLAQLKADLAACVAANESSDEEGESSGPSCDTAPIEAAIAAAEATKAACAAKTSTEVANYTSQASEADQCVADAKKTLAASRAKGKGDGPAKSLVETSGGGSTETPKDGKEVYSDKQCLEKSDAFKHVSCTDRYKSHCKDRLNDARCVKFVDHYCAVPAVPDPEAEEGEEEPVEGEASAETEENENYREPSDGIGSGFCQFAFSSRFCAEGNRGHCPSCTHISTLKSCSADAKPCLPELTETERTEAQNTCPTDPLFSNPDFSPDEEEEEEDTFVGDGTIPAGAPQVTSDIAPPTGPNLFDTHSEILNRRCREASLNCGSNQ